MSTTITITETMAAGRASWLSPRRAVRVRLPARAGRRRPRPKGCPIEGLVTVHVRGARLAR